jgi:hypothetical protein
VGSDFNDRAIFEHNDPVRIEMEKALERGVPLIPVLVNRARMPQPDELPETLHNLSFRNAAEVDAGRDFRLHIDRLIRSMDQILAMRGASAPAPEPVPTPPPQPSPAPEPMPSPPPEPAPALQPAAPPEAALAGVSQPVPRPQPRRRAILLAAAAAVAVALGGGAYLYFRPVLQTTTTKPKVARNKEVARPQTPKAAFDTACKPTAAFYDTFSPPDGGWGQSDPHKLFKDGRMVLRPKADHLASWIYFPLLFKNAVICSEVISPHAIRDLTGDAAGGIIFWADGYGSYYVAETYANATYAVWRETARGWIPVVPRRPASSLRKGPNAVNQLKLAIDGARAALFANGEKLIAVWGQPPERGGRVGLFGQSNTGEAAEWKFASIAVDDSKSAVDSAVAPAVPAPAAQLVKACEPQAAALFADDFKPEDPGWGQPSRIRLFKDGAMVLKPDVNKSVGWIFEPLILKKGAVCADIASPQVNKPQGLAEAGIIFWARDYDNYYQAAIHVDGSYNLSRLIDNRWVTVVPQTKSPSIRAGAGAVNRMKVTFDGEMATLAVNGSVLARLRGQPPADGGSIGLYGQSEEDRVDDWRILNIAVAQDNKPPLAVPRLSGVAVAAATACEAGAPAAFVDDFSRPDHGWGTLDASAALADGHLVLKPKGTTAVVRIYQPLVFDGATACAAVKSPPRPANLHDDAAGGMIFWAKDYLNYYLAETFRDDTFAVWRKLAGKWLQLVPRSGAKGLQQGPGAVNRVKAMTAGNRATLYINDASVASFWGQPPRVGGAVGVYAQSAAGEEDPWTFLNVAVMRDEMARPNYPPAAVAAANDCKPGSSPAFFDNFASPDPGWGASAETYYFKDGQMVLKPKAGHPEWWQYLPLVFQNAVICGDVRFPAVPSADGAAGIIFWAADPQNFYVSVIDPGGSYWVARRVEGEWALVVPRAKSSAIHSGPDARNQMRVILDHNAARININGVTVSEFRGQPPQGGGKVGFYAESGKATDAEWRFGNLVVAN